MTGHRVLVTGGNGFLGSSVIRQLTGRGAAAEGIDLVVSGDIRLPAEDRRVVGVVYEVCDVTDRAAVDAAITAHGIDTVIHLASIVNPGRDMTEEMEYRVDVVGSRNVIDACVAAGVRRIVVSSSGAAYGYHADNPDWLVETDALRGNDAFSYSRHKRMVEEMLAEARMAHPELEQVVFRIGTILGEGLRNQITALLDARRLLRVAGSDSPFVFIWHTDVAAALALGVSSPVTGAFNVAGDGALGVQELARRTGRGTVTVPAWALAVALRVGHALRLTPHTPARIDFLRFRPVLDNTALKATFGYTPSKTSAEAFEAFLATR